ncbi:hypothetical protein ABH935_002228 [Catenulispora sp. GAS73]|uniref:hypothetical protein n=1 Tax=Catenulispora sp. GAS73 TaxID=3156269 RepID=UPI0035190373
MAWQGILETLGVFASLGGIAGGYYAWRALDNNVVSASEDKFRTGRDRIREQFAELNELSATMHTEARPSLRRIGDSCMLIEDAMAPEAPLPLSELRIRWDSSAPPIDPHLAEGARRLLPWRRYWQRYSTYSAALGEVMRPGHLREPAQLPADENAVARSRRPRTHDGSSALLRLHRPQRSPGS